MYSGEEKRHESWHFKKEIHAGHILTTIMIVGTMIGIWANLDTRVTTNTVINDVQNERLKQLAKQTNEHLAVIRGDIRDMRNVLVRNGHGK